jgi:predicted AlkP superfamily pyrophosphatase or phosphodiesterase
MPSLVALHLINLDSVHHKYGPENPAGYSAAALADAMTRQVVDAVAAAGHADDTTFLIVSDHGFITSTHSIRPNVALRRAGLLTADEKGKIQTARAHVIPEGGIGLVYLTDPATAEADAAAVRQAFEGIEGVASVFGPDEYPRYHFPAPSAMPQMADLVIACKEGYSIGGSAAGDEVVVPQPAAGVHGYLSTEPRMKAVFIASGAGVRADGRLDTAENVDVAPTIARLLGVDLPTATGKAMDTILDGGR